MWEVPYQWGAMVAGSAGRFSYRLAAMNSAPSSEPEAWGFELDRSENPSWVAGVGVVLTPELQVGASWNRGPWLEEITEGDVSVAPNRFDYVQEMFSADARTFYGERRAFHYAVSWLLVHFLRHGREHWADERFPAFTLYVAEGYPPTESFEAVYGAPPAAFEEEFRRYVNRF